MRAKITFYKEERFKETLVGKVPEDWKVIKLGKVVEYEKGRKPSKLFKKQLGNSIIYLTAEYMRGVGAPQWCSATDPNIVRVDEHHIIMIWDGSYSGHVFIGFEGALASTMVKIFPRTRNIDVNYLFYVLSRSYPLLSGTTVGTGIPHVNKMVFKNLPIQIPSLEEQKAIAHVLLTLDKVIQKTNEIIEKTERLKKGLMQVLLTKGIGHKEFKDTEIGRIPKEWEVVKLGKIVNFKNGERPEIILKEGKIPIYGANGIMGYTNEYIVDNDFIIVIARVGWGTVGKVHLASGKVWVSDNAIYSQNYKSSVYLPYLFYLLKFIRLERFALRSAAGSYAIITQTSLQNLKLQLPPFEEQKKIAEILSTVDKRLEVERKRKEKLERIKKALMDLLLTGKIRIKVKEDARERICKV